MNIMSEYQIKQTERDRIARRCRYEQNAKRAITALSQANQATTDALQDTTDAAQDTRLLRALQLIDWTRQELELMGGM